DRFLAARAKLNHTDLKNPRSLELLVKTFSISQALSDALVHSPELFDWLLSNGALDAPKEKSTLTRELVALLAESTRDSALRAQHLSILRRFKRRELLRIGVRDLMNLASLEETTLEVSNLADVCVNQIYRLAYDDLVRQFGTPMFQVDENGKPHRADFCV